MDVLDLFPQSRTKKSSQPPTPVNGDQPGGPNDRIVEMIRLAEEAGYQRGWVAGRNEILEKLGRT